METDMIQPDWNEIRGRLKASFRDFTAYEIETLKGHLDQLPYSLQKVYGYSKDRAEKLAAEFRASLGPASAEFAHAGASAVR